MKLTGNLKKQVEAATTMEEKKDVIENAGMLLDDDELSAVAGGYSYNIENRLPPGIDIKVRMSDKLYNDSFGMTICPTCGGDLSNPCSNPPEQTADCLVCRIRWWRGIL